MWLFRVTETRHDTEVTPGSGLVRSIGGSPYSRLYVWDGQLKIGLATLIASARAWERRCRGKRAEQLPTGGPTVRATVHLDQMTKFDGGDAELGLLEQLGAVRLNGREIGIAAEDFE